MAAQQRTGVGATSLITTANAGTVVSTPFPSFEMPEGGLVNVSTNAASFQHVELVNLDNTYITHKQFRNLPTTQSSERMVFQFVVPEPVHCRDICLNLQIIITQLTKVTDAVANQNDDTNAALLANNYTLNAGGILGMFKNTRICIGQTEIQSDYEKQKYYYHMLNANLRGVLEQRNTFGLIDDFFPNYSQGQGGVNFALINDHAHNKLLSKVIAQKKVQFSEDNARDYANDIIENISIPLAYFHSVFQQDRIIPPGVQFILDFKLPMYMNYAGAVAGAGRQAANAYFHPIICCPNVVCTAAKDANAQALSYYFTDDYMSYTNNPNGIAGLDQTQFIGVAVNYGSAINCVSMNCRTVAPSIMKAVTEQRIQTPMVWNYTCYQKSGVGNFVIGQANYTFNLPPNQVVPQEFNFYWETLQGHVTKIPANGVNGTAWGAAQWTAAFPYTPLPVRYKRITVLRGGYQEIFLYNTYFNSLTAAGVSQLAGSRTDMRLLGVYNLSQETTHMYFDRLKDLSWNRLNLTGRTEFKYLYSYDTLGCYGRHMTFQMNPMSMDRGIYSQDQNPYNVSVTFEFDFSVLEQMTQGLAARDATNGPIKSMAQFVCVRAIPAQMSITFDNTVKQFMWPNLLINNQMPISGTGPPAAGSA